MFEKRPQLQSIRRRAKIVEQPRRVKQASLFRVRLTCCFRRPLAVEHLRSLLCDSSWIISLATLKLAGTFDEQAFNYH